MAYTPPSGGSVNFTFARAPLPPPVNIVFGATGASSEITVGSIAPGGFGSPLVRNAREQVFPPSIAPGFVGTPSQVKSTPQVYPTGITPGAFGTPLVKNRNVYIALNGFGPEVFGAPTTFLNSRFVLPPSLLGTGQFGSATTQNTQRFLVVTGIGPGNFGSPALSIRAVGPVRIPGAGTFGVPRLNGPQIIVGFDFPPPPLQVPQPRISPFAARMPGIAPVGFGVAAVSLFVRNVPTQSIDSLAFGETTVSNRTRYVQPVGILPFRVGSASIPGLRAIKPYWGRTTLFEEPGKKYDTALYGAAKVKIVGPYLQTASPTQIEAGGFGSTRVENQHRALSLIGIAPGDFGIARVALPFEAYPLGIDSAVFGTALVADRIRSVRPDSSAMTTQWGPAFGSGFFPMTVRHGRRFVDMVGIPAGGAPAPRVSTILNTLSPPGIVTGAFGAPAITARGAVLCAGFGGELFGNVKRPTQNLIEPYGDSMGSFGWPGLDFGAYMGSIAPGAMGAPRVRSGIHVAGIAGAFGDAVVIGESNCATKLAVIPMLGDTAKFGQPGVSR